MEGNKPFMVAVGAITIGGISLIAYARAKDENARLKAELAALKSGQGSHATSSCGKERKIRVWMDGAFDMMHYGHANAFRQAKALGTELVVGVNSDASIRKCKGSNPIMSDEERCTAVGGCRFVDEVVTEVPYVMDAKYLEEVVFGKYNIDYVVHGDDPCLDTEGNDVYAAAKAMGAYKSIPRTEGVSTTEIVGRMLFPGLREHLVSNTSDISGKRISEFGVGEIVKSRFLTTDSMLRLFSAGRHASSKEPKRIVYMDGAWDMFHAGHIEVIKKARALGDYLIVGIHSDNDISKYRSKDRPLMNIHERLLGVLSCKFVDDVLIGAPWVINEEMIKSLRVSVVAHGTTHDKNRDNDIYHVPQKLGIYHEVKSPSTLTVEEIIRRVESNREFYEATNKRKKAAEDQYYKDRYGMGDEHK